MKPYYEHAGITIYHWYVVNCNAWTLMSAHGATVHENGERMYRWQSRARSRGISRHQTTLRAVPGGAKSITHGKEMTYPSEAGEAERCADSAPSDLVPCAELHQQSDTTRTATLPTTPKRTLPFSAAPATWQRMDD